MRMVELLQLVAILKRLHNFPFWKYLRDSSVFSKVDQ